MMLASLSGSGLRENAIFDTSNKGNRDNCFAPYALLKTKFIEKGISINTPDVIGSEKPLFELHMDASTTGDKSNSYVLLLETPFIQPLNGNIAFINQYRKVFTWNDNLIDNDKFIKLNYPNPITIPAVDGFSTREIFCCMIAGNKQVSIPTKLELYGERVKSIHWFEKHAPQDFALFGTGWDKPAKRTGWKQKLSRPLWKLLSRIRPLSPFPSYRGKVPHKNTVLLNARFCICYENIKDLPGYITEKIFDAFFSGCIPVYWGANNIGDYIPDNCFIDRQKFHDTAQLYNHLKSIDEQQFMEYQRNIVAFLKSEKVRPFSSEFFAETIVNTIMADLDVR